MKLCQQQWNGSHQSEMLQASKWENVHLPHCNDITLHFISRSPDASLQLQRWRQRNDETICSPSGSWKTSRHVIVIFEESSPSGPRETNGVREGAVGEWTVGHTAAKFIHE